MIDIRFKPGQRIYSRSNPLVHGIVLDVRDNLINPITIPVHAILTHVVDFVILLHDDKSVHYYSSHGNDFNNVVSKVRLPSWL